MNMPVITVTPPSKNMDKKTIIVFGCGRGGTSMVSGTLRELGVFMGDRPHKIKHEYDFFPDGMTPKDMLEKVSYYNDHYDFWGWKSPKDVFNVGSFIHFLRNPCFLIVFRNPLSVAVSNQKHIGVPPEVILDQIMSVYSEISSFIGRTPFPIAMINYELAVNTPELYVNQIIEFLGINNIDPKFIENAINFCSGNNGYKAITSESEFFDKEMEKIEHDNLYDSMVIKNDMYDKCISGTRDGLKAMLSQLEQVHDSVSSMQKLFDEMTLKCINKQIPIPDIKSNYQPQDNVTQDVIEREENIKNSYIEIHKNLVEIKESTYISNKILYMSAINARIEQQRQLEILALRVSEMKALLGE